MLPWQQYIYYSSKPCGVPLPEWSEVQLPFPVQQQPPGADLWTLLLALPNPPQSGGSRQGGRERRKWARYHGMWSHLHTHTDPLLGLVEPQPPASVVDVFIKHSCQPPYHVISCSHQ